MYRAKPKKLLMQDDFVIYSRNRDYQTVLAKEKYYALGMDPGPENFAAGIETRSCVHPAETMTLFKFGVNKKKGDTKHNPTYFHFVEAIEQYSEWWHCIEIIYIERQMTINNDASEIFAAALTYLTLHCPDAVIIELNAKIKGKILGAPTGLSHHGMKMWSRDTAAPVILQERGDEFGQSRLKRRAGRSANENKMDDKADVVCTIEAAERYLRSL